MSLDQNVIEFATEGLVRPGDRESTARDLDSHSRLAGCQALTSRIAQQGSAHSRVAALRLRKALELLRRRYVPPTIGQCARKGGGRKRVATIEPRHRRPMVWKDFEYEPPGAESRSKESVRKVTRIDSPDKS